MKKKPQEQRDQEAGCISNSQEEEKLDSEPCCDCLYRQVLSLDHPGAVVQEEAREQIREPDCLGLSPTFSHQLVS